MVIGAHHPHLNTHPLCWYRPVHHLGLCALPMLRCSSFLAYTPNWPVALFLLLFHLPGTLYLLTFDCANCENILTFKRHLKTHNLVFLCCINRLCIFGPKGAIQIRSYYYYYEASRLALDMSQDTNHNGDTLFTLRAASAETTSSSPTH